MTAPAGPSARVLAPEEAAFAQAIAAGDERAFQLLIERHATPVLRICYRILGSVEEAEDAVQETFVLAFRARATFRGEGTAEAWLARIATRESWRRRARSNRRRAATLPIDEAVLDLLVDPADPALSALEGERGAAVREAVAALPEPYREVVALRWFADLSPAAIAAATNRPEGTVRAQLSRGAGRLRHLLRGMRP